MGPTRSPVGVADAGRRPPADGDASADRPDAQVRADAEVPPVDPQDDAGEPEPARDRDAATELLEPACDGSAVRTLYPLEAGGELTVRPERDPSAGCGTRACMQDARGVRMDYCCDGSGAWSQCRFWPFDLSAFDADSETGGRGLLEVTAFFEEPVPQGVQLTLYYSAPYPKRKSMVLVSHDESMAGAGPGLWVKYFKPEDADCPRYTTADYEAAKDAFDSVMFPSECVVAADAPEVDCNGKWTSVHDACRFDFSAAELQITAEHCGSWSWSNVTIVSVRHIVDPAACSCRSAADCQPGERCRTEAGIAAPGCEPGALCGGICAAGACERAGEACTVVVGDRECNSEIVCHEGRAVCAIPEAC